MLELDNVYCGDCACLMAELPDDFVDLCITSPPYGMRRVYNGFTFDFEAIAHQLYRITKPGGVVVWIVGDETKNGSESLSSFKQAIYFNEIGFNVDTMIYEKAGANLIYNWRIYPNGYEFMFVLQKGMAKTFNPICDRLNTQHGTIISGSRREPNGKMKPAHGAGRMIQKYGMRTNIWRYAAGFMLSSKDKDAFNHPAIFPEALARDHILSWSNPGDLVLDPMCGSGTTLKAAMQLGRRYLGFDISEEYCELSRNRVRNANPPLFIV